MKIISSLKSLGEKKKTAAKNGLYTYRKVKFEMKSGKLQFFFAPKNKFFDRKKWCFCQNPYKNKELNAKIHYCHPRFQASVTHDSKNSVTPLQESQSFLYNKIDVNIDISNVDIDIMIVNLTFVSNLVDIQSQPAVCVHP